MPATDELMDGEWIGLAGIGFCGRSKGKKGDLHIHHTDQNPFAPVVHRIFFTPSLPVCAS